MELRSRPSLRHNSQVTKELDFGKIALVRVVTGRYVDAVLVYVTDSMMPSNVVSSEET